MLVQVLLALSFVSLSLSGCAASDVEYSPTVCFRLLDNVLNWNKAALYCQDNLNSKAHLASFPSVEQLTTLWDSFSHETESYWLGLNNHYGNISFQGRADTDEALQWISDFVTPADETYSSCGVLPSHSHSGPDMHVTYSRCGHQKKFICEYDPTVGVPGSSQEQVVEGGGGSATVWIIVGVVLALLFIGCLVGNSLSIYFYCKKREAMSRNVFGRIIVRVLDYCVQLGGFAIPVSTDASINDEPVEDSRRGMLQRPSHSPVSRPHLHSHSHSHSHPHTTAQPHHHSPSSHRRPAVPEQHADDDEPAELPIIAPGTVEADPAPQPPAPDTTIAKRGGALAFLDLGVQQELRRERAASSNILGRVHETGKERDERGLAELRRHRVIPNVETHEADYPLSSEPDRTTQTPSEFCLRCNWMGYGVEEKREHMRAEHPQAFREMQVVRELLGD